MTILGDLYAFLQEQRCPARRDGGVEGDRVWMTCACGAVINRSQIGTNHRSGSSAVLVPVATFG